MRGRNYFLVDVLIFVLIFLFFLHFFSPKLLFLETTISGGDTASHYPTAVYLKKVLLPEGKVMGWNPSNYAGFPLFYHYFPLSFLLMVALSLLAPLKVAFKLVTFLSVILLPPSVYLMFYFLGYGRGVSCIGSLVSVAFLFNEKNSMWGGNIPSMLAGEFSFSLSLVFFTVLFGSIYKGIKEKRHLVLNAFLVALTGLSHGYTLVTMGISNIFYLFSENWKSNLYYLFRVYFFGSFLMAFWFKFLPLLSRTCLF